MSEKVIMLWGEESVRRYFDVYDRSNEAVRMLLDHVDVYVFDTEGEAEAFRLGVCAGGGDFCELTSRGYSNLLALKEEAI